MKSFKKVLSLALIPFLMMAMLTTDVSAHGRDYGNDGRYDDDRDDRNDRYDDDDRDDRNDRYDDDDRDDRNDRYDHDDRDDHDDRYDHDDRDNHGHGNTSNNNTVDHIDLGISLTANIVIDGKTYVKTYNLDESDLNAENLSITCTGSGLSYNLNRFTTSTGQSGVKQIRISGTFPVGTYANPVAYTVSLKKTVTVATDNGNVTMPVTFEANFNYWSADNDCPGLGRNWASGNVTSGSGLDFLLGNATTDVSTKGTITIQKAMTGIELEDGESENYTFNIYTADGTLYKAITATVSDDTNGTYYAAASVSDVPYGVFYVVEGDATEEGYTLDVSYQVGASSQTDNCSEAFVLSAEQDDVTVVVTNAYTAVVPEPTPEPSVEPSPAPEVTPEPTPAPSVEPSPAPEVTPEPTPAPSEEPSPAPSAEPTPEPSVEPSPAPEVTPEPTPAPSVEPSPAPEVTPEPTPAPSEEPSPAPSAEPTPEPSVEPSPAPEVTPEPTPEPSEEPSPAPSAEPTPEPSVQPSPEPSAEPTPEPSVEPSPAPSTEPTPAPVVTPAPAQVVVIEDEDTPLADATVLGANRGTPSLNADAAVLGEDRRPSTGDESGIWVAGFWISLTCMAAWLAYTKKK